MGIIFLLTYIVRARSEITDILSSINNSYYILIALALLIISTLVFSFRFLHIINRISTKETKLKYHSALYFSAISGIANIGSIGKLGIPTKAVLLKKNGYSTKESIFLTSVDTIFDVVLSFLIAIMAIQYIPKFNLFREHDIAAFVILVSLTVIILAKVRNSKLITSIVENLKRMNNRVIITSSTLTLAAWLLASISYYFCIIAINGEADILPVIIIFFAGIVSGILSPIAGGIGVREGMLTILSTTINIEPSKGLLIAIMHRILSITALLFLLIVLQLNKNNNLTEYKVKNYYAIENKRELKAKKIISIIQRDVIIDNKIVLEIGSGYGHMTRFFGENAKQAVGIDVSHELINISKNKHRKCNFICGNGTTLPVRNECIDVIILNHVIEHTKYKQEMIAECNRVLNKNGIIYIATPNKHFPIDPHTKIPFFGYMGNKIHDKYNIYNLTKKELVELFEQNDLSYKYISTYIIRNITEFPEYNTPAYKFASKFIRCCELFSLPDFLIPTHIFTLRKIDWRVNT